MKHTTKFFRMLTFLLIPILCLSTLTFSAFAEGEEDSIMPQTETNTDLENTDSSDSTPDSTVETEICEHDYAATDNVFGESAFSCVGYLVYKCTKCGTSLVQLGPPHDMVYSPCSLASPSNMVTCSQCGKEVSAYWWWQGTRFLEYASQGWWTLNAKYDLISTTAPTCTEPGYSTYQCDLCYRTDNSDIVPALGHDYKEEVVEPTTEEQGYTTHTCSRCGDTYTDNFIEPIHEHSFSCQSVTDTCITGITLICDIYTCDCGESYSSVQVLIAH